VLQFRQKSSSSLLIRLNDALRHGELARVLVKARVEATLVGLTTVVIERAGQDILPRRVVGAHLLADLWAPAGLTA
jgi:hypothetical protein